MPVMADQNTLMAPQHLPQAQPVPPPHSLPPHPSPMTHPMPPNAVLPQPPTGVCEPNREETPNM
ncbi:unnamed protein product [Oppiella nova]|uniref:Uncharacterized protein n=1 Tax=Oppiella nova TaxID=334625 RepID=A0A7R9MUN4_9ACAR|nr:unnamed protein product [Oppiella nova]CAG2183696.1 unnamed protein product [Oppiella nova]